jgi:simple sugar transport system ATP-binding protein
MALLEARGMVRTYGSVVALDGADFDIEAGQVTALIGDNGAGKSTMVKILSGTEQFEEGEVTLEGQRVVFNNPAAARSHGIETVFQDLALCPHLDPVENLYLNREIKRSGVLGLLGFMDRSFHRLGCDGPQTK